MNRFTVSFLNILNKEMGTSGIPVLNKLLTNVTYFGILYQIDYVGKRSSSLIVSIGLMCV